jgi:hypothetical protein
LADATRRGPRRRGVEVVEDRLDPRVGAARQRADVGRDLSIRAIASVGAIEDVLDRLRLALHQAVDPVGHRRDRPVDQPAHVLGQVLDRQQHRVDVGQALVDAAQQLRRARSPRPPGRSDRPFFSRVAGASSPVSAAPSALPGSISR